MPRNLKEGGGRNLKPPIFRPKSSEEQKNPSADVQFSGPKSSEEQKNTSADVQFSSPKSSEEQKKKVITPSDRPYFLSACERQAGQKRINIKLAANEYLFSFVWHDAHKQRENIWYLVIIIGVESYNDYQVFQSYNDYHIKYQIFSLLVSVMPDKRE